MRRRLLALALASWCGATAFVQDPRRPLGPGPAWGGGRPAGSNEVFATADGCARCHSGAENSNAMRSRLGEDVSPHRLWQATVMANSFRDPYWRAAVARECAEQPDRAGELQGFCMRCHAPMHERTRTMGGQEPLSVRQAADDPLARDGVSCTVCHQIRARSLGDETTFDGKGRIGRGRVIYGPYEHPEADVMRGMSGYAAMHGEHLRDAALCGTCHTLSTRHQGERFPEQTPYLEWRNSVFSDEEGATGASRTCQQCHMADVGPTRIARNPDGSDFLLPARGPYRAHAFVGGNAFLLELLADHRERLGVEASAQDLRRMAKATRRQLTTATVDVTIGEVAHRGDELHFEVRVDNLTGHKFPTGYPARRAWLHVRVENEQGVVFDCGGFDRDGAIEGVISPLEHEHVDRIESTFDVLVWEQVADDPDGEPTTSLTRMARRRKDNRLLPKGWRADGPHAADTAPVGIGDDADFVGGSDTVRVVVPYAQGLPKATVLVWVHYQPIPPHWVDDLRYVDAEECETFVEIYDAADHTPETIAAARRLERL
ncbi:MAG: hypothetical protein ACE37K_07095 [Planctomycetota bacterium]